MPRRLTLVALISVIALCALFSPRALAQGTLDQSNTAPPTAELSTATGFPIALGQTFTAGITGLLDTATLQVFSGGPGVKGTVQLYATTGAQKPTGPALAAAVITTTSPFPGVLTAVTFSPAAPVTAGQVYALVLTPLDSAFIAWSASQGDTYPAGTALLGENANGPFSVLSGQDFDFQTFVTPPAPAPAPVILITNPPVTLGITIVGHGSLTPPASTLVYQLQAVAVRAVPDPGSVFVGWTGGPCSGTTINPCDIAPNGMSTIVATFAP